MSQDYEVHPDAAFSLRTFEILRELDKDDHIEPYLSSFYFMYGNFVESVEIPLKGLGLATAKKLPKAIIDKLQSLNNQDGLFQIYTNEDENTEVLYAFYFTNIANYSDVQFYILVDECGFHLGLDNHKFKKFFYRNLEKYSNYLYLILNDLLYDKCVRNDLDITKTEDSSNKLDIYSAFLKNRNEYMDCISINKFYFIHEVLGKSFDELCNKITQIFIDLFPFVILAISDDPVPEIYKFTGFIDYKYIIDKITEKTYLPESEIQRYINTLERKKHIIFQGSPGTGKTYLAKQLAHYLTHCNDSFYEIIQFHPAYTYEDFIQGIRPITREDSQLEYKMIKGRFLEFCEKAENCKTECILIIDEINRANLSQVFGELMYLLEYRDEKIQLAGSNQPFKIPKNVRIIGTMNTADRSIALVDHALRHRFAIINLHTNYDILEKYHQKHNTHFPVDKLTDILKKINLSINDPHYSLGISYFLTPTLTTEIENIWYMEIEPYLEEYFFNKPDEIDPFRWNKIKNEIFP